MEFAISASTEVFAKFGSENKIEKNSIGSSISFLHFKHQIPKRHKMQLFSGIMLHFVDSDSSESEESLAQV